MQRIDKSMKAVCKDVYKRSMAVVLCIAMVIGIAGCDAFGVRKSMGVMNDRLINFNKALNELDYEAVRSLTDWTEADSDYTAIEEIFDTSYYGDTEGEGFVSCTEYIASTINIKYSITSVQINYNQASLDVEYEMVDWQAVYKKTHNNYDEVLEELKNCPDKTAIDLQIVFENVDGLGDWRLCRINDLGGVMSFVYTLPEING